MNEWSAAAVRAAPLYTAAATIATAIVAVPLDCVMVVLADYVPRASDSPICCCSQVRPIRPAASASAAAAEPHVQTRVPQMLALK